MTAMMMQFVGSLAAVLLLVVLAWRLRLGGEARLGDEDEARELADHTLCGFDADEIALDRAGRAALLRDGAGRIMLLSPHGNRHIGRVLDAKAKAQLDGDRLTVTVGEARLRSTTMDSLMRQHGAARSAHWTEPMPDFDPVALAIPLFVGLIVIEMIWARRRMPHAYEPRDTAMSLALGLGSTVAGAVAAGAVFGLMTLIHGVRLFDIGWQWWAWLLCFVLDDLAYYWFHRFAHRVRWFWASHVNHHSSQHYNLSTALRQSWTGFVAVNFVFRLPLALIGFEPAMVVFCGGLNLIYQFWIHTEAIGRLPRWIEAVMNTPSHHRVHHATNPRYLDRNYAGTFIVWDRLFGTFEPEAAGERIRYGIVKQLGSFNVLWAVFHEWFGMAEDVRHAPWRHKLSYLWREPGWSHDGSRDTSETIRARWLARQGNDASLSERGTQERGPQPPSSLPADAGRSQRR